jgi:hypothetical protein
MAESMGVIDEKDSNDDKWRYYYRKCHQQRF